MQNTSKPGGLTPITLAVWVCAADKVRLSVSRCTPPPIVSQNIPPAAQIVRQTSHVRTMSNVYRWFLGSDSSHMTSLTWRHRLKMLKTLSNSSCSLVILLQMLRISQQIKKKDTCLLPPATLLAPRGFHRERGNQSTTLNSARWSNNPCTWTILCLLVTVTWK